MNWEQFRAILWLRWRLSRNQFLRGSGTGAVIAALAGVLLTFIALGAAIGGTLLGALALSKATPQAMMFAWDGVAFFVIFFSLLGVLTELQRSESVDLTRLLHLPIGLKQVFVFNYLASLISFGPIVILAGVMGMAAGLVISRGVGFLWVAPLALTFVFMITAWIYCLRGWLLSLMVNPRRRRSIIMCATLVFILISQAPQLINLAWQRRAREARIAAQQSAAKDASKNKSSASEPPNQYAAAAAFAEKMHPWVPILWLPNGVRALATGDFLPMFWGTAGMLVIGWLGIGRAYRSTLKFYRGEENVSSTPVPDAPIVSGKPVANWVERRLPWLAEDTAAVVMAQVRSMSRAPEIRMMLAMGLFMSIFLPLMILWRSSGSGSFPIAARPFVGTGMMMMVLFSLLQLVCNQFGCDREAFRGFILLPTSRTRLLFGKNLALLPVASMVAVVPLIAVSVMAHLTVTGMLATLVQFCAAFLMYCIIGNLASIFVPYRIAAGSLKPSKQSWQTFVGLLAVHLTFPFVISPMFIPPLLGLLGAEVIGWPPGLINLAAALILLAVMVMVYALTLPPLGRLLQRRETHILRSIAETTE